MLNCHICDENALEEHFEHREWNKPVMKCRKCGHSALYDSRLNKNTGTNFRTGEIRANRYLRYLKDLSFESVLEIGTPSDFYMLKQIHNMKPNCSVTAFDIFAKENVPDFINFVSLDRYYEDDANIAADMLNKFTGKQYDLILCTHVFEHVPNINNFIAILKHSKHFIFEIPCYNDLYFEEAVNGKLDQTAWHYQFFNETNIVRFFKKHGIDCKIMISFDEVTPYNKGNLIMTNYDLTFSENCRILL